MQIINGWYFKMARWSNLQQMYLSQTSLVLQDWHVIVSIKTKCTHWNKNNCARGVKHFNIVIISNSNASTSDYQFCLMWITWFLSLPQVGGSTEAFLKAGPTQPFVLWVGERKNIIQSFYPKFLHCPRSKGHSLCDTDGRCRFWQGKTFQGTFFNLPCPLIRHWTTSTHSSRPSSVWHWCWQREGQSSGQWNKRKSSLYGLKISTIQHFDWKCSSVTFARYTTQVAQCYLDIWSSSMVCTQESFYVWPVESLDVHLSFTRTLVTSGTYSEHMETAFTLRSSTILSLYLTMEPLFHSL